MFVAVITILSKKGSSQPCIKISGLETDDYDKPANHGTFFGDTQEDAAKLAVENAETQRRNGYLKGGVVQILVGELTHFVETPPIVVVLKPVVKEPADSMPA